jgi:hypothetical protein
VAFNRSQKKKPWQGKNAGLVLAFELTFRFFPLFPALVCTSHPKVPQGFIRPFLLPYDKLK